MSKFRTIENKLAEYAQLLNGVISIDRPNYPKSLRTFEERRIDWIDGSLNKSIVIHPKFELAGVNSNLWTFKLVAYSIGENGLRKNSWTNELVSHQDFDSIEKEIDNLLKLGKSELEGIVESDLLPPQGIYLFLDLDGVLITTPSWKADEIDEDGYSRFNSNCVNELNNLLNQANFQIWLSSSRRKVKPLEEFNQIFKNRGITGRIIGYLPDYKDCKTRKDEVLKFVSENDLTKFIILDDDNSLNSLPDCYKRKFVKTDHLIGFSKREFESAVEIINNEI